jgi:hypothetical protein
MTTPTITLYPDTLPAKGQANAPFDVNVDDFLTWLTATNGPELAAMITWTQGVADTVLATALAGNLPALTGKALNFIRANAAEDGGEFRTPAQVLSDILAAPLASPALTGNPTGPTAAAATNTTQLATTAQVRLAIPNVLNATGSAPLYGCRAWVNFNGTGVVAIRASGNVSSITDNGTGDYTVNFATAMSDANYAPTVGIDDGGTDIRLGGSMFDSLVAGSFRIRTGNSETGVLQDKSGVFASIFR